MNRLSLKSIYLNRDKDKIKKKDSIWSLGLAGENAAARFLQKHGYQIITKRWRCRWGEIDLVAKKGNEIIFVEVKTRTGDGYGGGLAAVGWRKSNRLRAAAYAYLNEHNLVGRPFRLDVVTVEPIGCRRFRVRHYPSAIGEVE